MKKNDIVKGFVVSALILLLNFSVAAQTGRQREKQPDRSWFDLMQDPGAKFKEVQEAFYRWWDVKSVKLEEEREKSGGPNDEEEVEGVGYQLFKRWEYINEFRVLPDGKLQQPGYVQEQYRKYMADQDATNSAAGTWSLSGPSAYFTNNTTAPTGMGRINAIAFHPTDAGTIYIGSPSGGFWKTTNPNGNSTTWTNLSNNLPLLGVSSILINPSDPNIIYIGTGDRDGGDTPGIGVYKTTDGGATWTSASTGMGSTTVGCMLMHPLDPNTIIAATKDGIYKTTNGGSTWSLKQAGDFRDVKFKPGDPTVVYAARYVNPSEFYKSQNTGESWTKNTSIPTSGIGSRIVIGVTPADPSYVYLVLLKSDQTFLNLYRSTDYGVTFSAMASTPPNLMGYNCIGDDMTTTQATYDLCIAVDPTSANTVFVGGINTWKTTDGGANWTAVSNWVSTCSATVTPVHADHHVLVWSLLNGNLYLGHDGGITMTANKGGSWTEITGALPISQIYKLGQGASNAGYVVFGLQDNGCGASLNGSTFYTVNGGDGGECEIDYANSNYCYDTYINGPIRRSTTGPAGSYSTIAGNGVNGITETSAWITPYALHKTVHTTMFGGYKNVWRTTNVTSSPPAWVQISSGETANSTVLKQSPVNADLLYIVRSGAMKRTENANDAAGSVTWTSCTLPGGYTPTDLAAHPTDANTLYAAAGYGVYKSTDKGATWTSMTANLPAIFTNCLVYDKNSNEGLYVGNQTGVWYKDATMANWMLFSNGLPPVDIRELEIYYDATPSNNRIKAATYGRGLWQSDLATVTVIDPTSLRAYEGSARVDLTWTKNAANDNVVVAWAPVNVFGQPADGTAYAAGNSIPGGGTVIYSGPASTAPHTGLSASTTYYYKAWSVNGSNQYSAGVLPISTTTDCAAVTTLPFTASFDDVSCWKVVDNTGNRSWQFGSTTNSNNPPTILNAPYAYFKSTPGSTVSFNSDLISPPLDLSSLSSVVLTFNQHYDGDAVWASIARVYYTTDNGLNWNLLATYTTDQNNTPVALLVPGAAGQSNVKFRWNYFDDATGSYFWGIDDVEVKACSGIWTGSVSTDWNTAGNWCNNAVPAATTDVIIPGGVTNMPDISTTTVALCRNISIQSGATLKMSAANSVLEVKGNWTMYGSFNYSSSSTSSMVKFNGSSLQSIGGSANTRLCGFTIDNTAGVTLSTELRADNNIRLTNGIVTTTGSGKVYDVYNLIVRTNGWVNGTLQKYGWSGNVSVENRTYQIGDATNYTPVALSFPISAITGTGPISMKTTAGDHPNIGTSSLDGSLSVNRYWSFPTTMAFTSCTATFTFVSGDLDAGTITGNLGAGQYKSAAWSYPSTGTKTSTTVQVTGLASATLGDIQLAETVSTPDWANLQWPASGTIAVGGAFTVYTQAYEPNVTPGAGQGAGMQCWIGYSTANTDPSTWTNWIAATYNTESGNNDEYMANLGSAIASGGTYYYASRFRRGSSAYVYGGYQGGFWNGTTNVNGTLTVNGPTFTGTGNWTDAARWNTGSVPANSDNTIIDGNCTVTGSVTTADLTILATRSLTVAPAGNLTVTGTLTNNGGAAGLSLKSDATGTGSMIHSTAGVSGTVERYMNNADWSNGQDGWHFLSSPVAVQAISPNFTTDPYDFYCWYEPQSSWVNFKNTTTAPTWNTVNGGTDFNRGQGYLAAYDQEGVKAFSGTLNTADVTISGLAVTPGAGNRSWHLLGNPFCSALTWDATAPWQLSNVGGVAKIWNEANQSYSDLTSSPSSVIPATNGFMVQVISGTGSLVLPAAKRVISPVPFYKSSGAAMTLKVIAVAEQNAQETRIMVADGSTTEFDPLSDGEFLKGYAPQFYSLDGDMKLSTNTQPILTAATEIPLGFVKTEGNDYRIEAVDAATLAGSVRLYDLKTGSVTDLVKTPSYAFTASAGDLPERFLLKFGSVGIGDPDANGWKVWYSNNILYVIISGTDGYAEVFSLTGQRLLSGKPVNGKIEVRLASGIYVARITSGSQLKTIKFHVE